MARYSLPKIRAFVEGFASEGFWVGVDVHKRSYHAALRRGDGRQTTWVGSADPREFVQAVVDLGVPIHGIAYEAGPTGFCLAREVAAAGLDCIVAAPSKIPRPVSAGSDRAG